MSEIKKLIEERVFLQGRLNKVNNLIQAIQEHCTHPRECLEYIGTKHNDVVYKCSKCNAEVNLGYDLNKYPYPDEQDDSTGGE